MKLSHSLALAFLACFAFACGDGGPAEPETSSPAASGTATPTQASATSGGAKTPTLTEQATAGQKLFQDHCAKCHGASVSVSAFASAADLADYIEQNMPRDAPGSLTQSEYFSIVAFDLAARGVDLHGETLDATNAASTSTH